MKWELLPVGLNANKQAMTSLGARHVSKKQVHGSRMQGKHWRNYGMIFIWPWTRIKSTVKLDLGKFEGTTWLYCKGLYFCLMVSPLYWWLIYWFKVRFNCHPFRIDLLFKSGCYDWGKSEPCLETMQTQKQFEQFFAYYEFVFPFCATNV